MKYYIIAIILIITAACNSGDQKPVNQSYQYPKIELAGQDFCKAIKLLDKKNEEFSIAWDLGVAEINKMMKDHGYVQPFDDQHTIFDDWQADPARYMFYFSESKLSAVSVGQKHDNPDTVMMVWRDYKDYLTSKYGEAEKGDVVRGTEYTFELNCNPNKRLRLENTDDWSNLTLWISNY